MRRFMVVTAVLLALAGSLSACGSMQWKPADNQDENQHVGSGY